MTHRKGAVWTERLVLALILASLGGTLNLVVAIHRRVHSTTTASKTSQVAPPSPKPLVKPPAPSPPIVETTPVPAEPSPQPKPPEDPTSPILARIEGAIVREKEAARAADRRASAMEKAGRASIAESGKWKRREMLVRQQIADLNEKADKVERDALTLDAERDVLARERDALKAALAKDGQRSGFAVLPYKGPNGTWRRPIVLECADNKVTLRPRGPEFSLLELSPLIHPRSSPVVIAIAREMLHIQRAETPDGAPAVPYLVFLVRPDGIRSYYMARARLEPLGIAFGYELVEQDLAVDIPDFDDIRTWDGTKPLEIAESDAKPRAGLPSVRGDEPDGGPVWPGGVGSGREGRSGTGRSGHDGRWPELARGDDAGTGAGAIGNGSKDGPEPELDLGGGRKRGGSGREDGGSEGSPDDFVWPTTSGGASPSGNRGTGRDWGREPAAGVGDHRERFPGTSPTGSGNHPPSGSTGPSGGRLASGPSRRGPSGTGGAPGLESMEGNPGLLARGGSPGRVPLSSPDGRVDRGGSGRVKTADAGGGNGNGGELPDLEPSRDGASGSGTPLPAVSSGIGNGGAGRAGSSPLPDVSAPSPGSGGAGGSFANRSVQPGGGGTGRPDMPDPGASPYSGRSGSPERGNPGTGPIGQPGADAGPGGVSLSSEVNPGLKPPASGSPGRIAGSNETRSRPNSPSTPSYGLGSLMGSPAADGELPSSFFDPRVTSGEPPSSADGSASGSSGGASSRSAGGSIGGLPGRSNGQPPSSMPAGAAGLALNGASGSADADAEQDSFTGLSLPSIDPHRQPGAIDVPFEIVVVCRRDDVLLHPGGYRITAQSLESGAGQGPDTEPLLQRELRAIVRKRAQVDPLIRPKPRIKFLVESGGSSTFWRARRRLTFSDLNWPMSVQVAGPQTDFSLDERIRR